MLVKGALDEYIKRPFTTVSLGYTTRWIKGDRLGVCPRRDKYVIEANKKESK